jgi:hypothetical protein
MVERLFNHQEPSAMAYMAKIGIPSMHNVTAPDMQWASCKHQAQQACLRIVTSKLHV